MVSGIEEGWAESLGAIWRLGCGEVGDVERSTVRVGGQQSLTLLSSACTSSLILFLHQGAQQGLACVQAGSGDAALPSARRTACEELCP